MRISKAAIALVAVLPVGMMGCSRSKRSQRLVRPQSGITLEALLSRLTVSRSV